MKTKKSSRKFADYRGISARPGYYESSVPLVLNEDYERPYCKLSLTGDLQAPRIWFNPPALVLTPVPLNIHAVQQVHVFASNYIRCELLSSFVRLDLGVFFLAFFSAEKS